MNVYQIQKSQQLSTLTASLQSCSRRGSVIVALIGCVVILGWIWDISALKSVLPGLVTMKANTAICFILAGASLRLLLLLSLPRPNYVLIQFFALVALLIGLAGFIGLGLWQGLLLHNWLAYSNGTAYSDRVPCAELGHSVCPSRSTVNDSCHQY